MNPAISEKKAVLTFELHQLVKRVPVEVNEAGIQTTRVWMRRQRFAFRVCASERSSVRQLEMAIKTMRTPVRQAAA